MGEIAMIVISAALFYAPAFFLQKVVQSLEITERDGGNWGDEAKEAMRWGWVYIVGLIGVSALVYLGSYDTVTRCYYLTYPFFSDRSIMVTGDMHTPSADEDPAQYGSIRQDTS